MATRKYNPAVTPVVATIHRQLLALGLRGRGIGFVQWNENTLKVNRGERGALITYMPGRDLYEVQGYEGFEKGPVVGSVYAEDLGRIVKPLLGLSKSNPFLGQSGRGRRGGYDMHMYIYQVQAETNLRTTSYGPGLSPSGGYFTSDNQAVYKSLAPAKTEARKVAKGLGVRTRVMNKNSGQVYAQFSSAGKEIKSNPRGCRRNPLDPGREFANQLPQAYVKRRSDGRYAVQLVYPSSGRRINKILSASKLAELKESGNYNVYGGGGY